MKKLFVILVSTFFIGSFLQAQSVKWGIRGGISTPEVKPSDLDSIRLVSGSETFALKVRDANYGFHGGLWMRVRWDNFFIQPEVLFNSNKVTYRLRDLRTQVVLRDSIAETFQRLDIPIMFGTRLSALRISAGPVAHYNLKTTSELTAVRSDYKAKLNQLTWGYQAGLGLDFGRLGIDIRYEGNFSNFGDHITVGSNAYKFDKTPSRFIATAAISF
jgi:hypothetical protein